jgi:hypothetical protein
MSVTIYPPALPSGGFNSRLGPWPAVLYAYSFGLLNGGNPPGVDIMCTVTKAMLQKDSCEVTTCGCVLRHIRMRTSNPSTSNAKSDRQHHKKDQMEIPPLHFARAIRTCERCFSPCQAQPSGLRGPVTAIGFLRPWQTAVTLRDSSSSFSLSF